MEKAKQAKRVKITALHLSKFAGPGVQFNLVGGFNMGIKVTVLEEKDGWLQVGPGAWIPKEHTQAVK